MSEFENAIYEIARKVASYIDKGLVEAFETTDNYEGWLEKARPYLEQASMEVDEVMYEEIKREYKQLYIK